MGKGRGRGKEMARKNVFTQTFYVGVAAQMDKFDERLEEMDRDISQWIRDNAYSPKTEIMITSAMGENVYAVHSAISHSI
jgi:succinate dehydrogenase flavin-adding protein (antitoxin of CptAB toxin-antitoxin module)